MRQSVKPQNFHLLHWQKEDFMVKSRRVFTREFKLAAIKELDSGRPLGYVARQLEVSANTLHRWRREFREQPTKAFSGQGRRVLAESREASWSGRSAS